MTSVERLEPINNAIPAHDFSPSKLFNDVYSAVATAIKGVETDLKEVATKIEEHPIEAATIGALTVGVAAIVTLTKGRALAGMFRSGLGEEATISKAATAELAGERPVGNYLSFKGVGTTGENKVGQLMIPAKRNIASFDTPEDPYGPDPHGEQHDPGLPANQGQDQMKPPSSPYGDDPFANMQPVKFPSPFSPTVI
jgi:hypothetical protein